MYPCLLVNSGPYKDEATAQHSRMSHEDNATFISMKGQRQSSDVICSVPTLTVTPWCLPDELLDTHAVHM